MNPNAPAITSREAAVTHAGLARLVEEATGRLRSRGVVAGDRVGLWSANSLDGIVIALAVERAGAVLVPLNARLADPEIEWQLGLARPKFVVASEELAARSVRGAPVHSFEAFDSVSPIEGGADETLADPTRDAVIVFTSGTTGRPKGAVLTRANRAAAARAAAAVLPLGEGDRWLASLPFFHVGGLGLLSRAFASGACVHLPGSFSADDLAEAIADRGITHASVVDATLARILEAFGEKPLPSRVKALVVGGGPVSPALIEACPVALATYGLTESCAMATLVRPGAPRSERRTAGRPLPGIEARIAEDGIVELRGPTVMRGYLDDEAATSRVLVDGWLRTGDLGEIDAAGCLTILARREDLIVSGGENVYPAEIERVLKEHPRVLEAAVIGVPDERWGQAPLAFVQAPGVGEAELAAFVALRLASYKRPRISFVDAIPRLASGKPDRAALKKIGVK